MSIERRRLLAKTNQNNLILKVYTENAWAYTSPEHEGTDATAGIEFAVIDNPANSLQQFAKQYYFVIEENSMQTGIDIQILSFQTKQPISFTARTLQTYEWNLDDDLYSENASWPEQQSITQLHLGIIPKKPEFSSESGYFPRHIFKNQLNLTKSGDNNKYVYNDTYQTPAEFRFITDNDPTGQEQGGDSESKCDHNWVSLGYVYQMQCSNCGQIYDSEEFECTKCHTIQAFGGCTNTSCMFYEPGGHKPH